MQDARRNPRKAARLTLPSAPKPIRPAAPDYRGRFAPSPTGRLHAGSLLAALGSFLDARAHQGEWLVRIEDLDEAREIPGAAADILHALDRFGLHWDGPVVYQRQRLDLYHDALTDLQRRGLTYPCQCSRKMIAARAQAGPDGLIYPDTCRRAMPVETSSTSTRLRLGPGSLTIHDRIHGDLALGVHRELGDFVVRRADGIPTYQVAVVVDDAASGVNHVVRGADLLFSAFRQRALQDALQLAAPSYAHLPVVLDSHGRKLSKSDAAQPVDPAAPLASLKRAWSLLGQDPLPADLDQLEDFLSMAIARWSLNKVPTKTNIDVISFSQSQSTVSRDAIRASQGRLARTDV